MHTLYIIRPGPRPPFGELAEHLWGAGCNINSDGDSADPWDVGWTELTVELRDGGTVDDRVDVDPVSEEPLVLKVQSRSSDLVHRAAEFLARATSGVIADRYSKGDDV